MRINLTLRDVPGLEALDVVCRQFGVSFTAFGGIVRRYVATHVQPQANNIQNDEFTLFRLVPFASDIDLVHSGGKELTPQIYQSLQTTVPFAECFRWELKSAEEYRLFSEANLHSAVIPANLMSLSTESGRGVNDPWNGQGDIRQQSFRFIRNGYYSRSPLFRAGRDLEFFSALLYFRILLETGAWEEKGTDQPGWQDAVHVVRDADTMATIILLQESAYLRARLRYLLKNLVVASSSHESLMRMVAETRLQKLLTTLDRHCVMRNGSEESALSTFSDELMLGPERCSVASARIGGDIFRLPLFSSAWDMGHNAAEVFEELNPFQPWLREARSETPSQDIRFTLAEGQRVVLASPQMFLGLGQSPSSSMRHHGGKQSGPVDEFVHFAVPLTAPRDWFLKEVAEEDLAVIMALNGTFMGKPASILLPMTSACSHRQWPVSSLFGGTLLTIRVNCGAFAELAYSLFEQEEDTDGKANAQDTVQKRIALQCFVLQWTATTD